MRYKIGNVAKMLGISRDLLRYYEKKGVVHPQKDKGNDYRYYDTWDINFLLDCIWYKQFGFGIDQIAHMITDCSYEELLSGLDDKREEIRRIIRQQELLLGRIGEHREQIARINKEMIAALRDMDPQNDFDRCLKVFEHYYGMRENSYMAS